VSTTIDTYGHLTIEDARQELHRVGLLGETETPLTDAIWSVRLRMVRCASG
jgi:hypothetical protein